MKHPGTKQIETERLILRRFTLEDAESMYRNWANDPEVTKYLTWPAHQTVETSRSVLETWVSSYINHDFYQWCIQLKAAGEPIGSISVVSIQEDISSMEIGYCIGRSFWHQGITSEALQAVTEYLQKEAGALRLECKHDTRNPNSGKVMKKCGYSYEGTKKRAYKSSSGICDCAFYGLVLDGGSCSPVHAKAEQQSPHSQNMHSQSLHSPVEITDELLESVSILAKLELSPAEKQQAKSDMEKILAYVSRLNGLDTDGVEPMTHIFPVRNVFREDTVTNGDGSKAALANAPAAKDGGFLVPKTIS